MNSGSTHGSSAPGDYELGRRIATLFAQQSASNLPATAVFSQVQDLLGADTSLLGPLRDLLARPSFRQLFGGGQHSVLLAGRDALLQDLTNTYHPAMVARLAAVIDGSLGLPPGPPPSAAAGGSAGVPPSGAAWGAPWSQSGQAPPWGSSSAGAAPGQGPYSQPPYSQAPYGAAPGPTPPQPVPVVVSTSGGGGTVTALLIVLVSLLTGAVLLGLGWLLLANRVPSLGGGTAQSSSTPAPTPSPSPAPPPTPKEPSLTAEPAPGGSAWGSASEYKFGRLPGGDYPNSCAFSVTDGNGRTTTDKSQIEYWACRDVGGSPDSGYRVLWSDGKETNYTFQSGGDGQVVGTNGSTYPMRWRNDTHQGDPIVVINHQDGAITWIPGRID